MTCGWPSRSPPIQEPNRRKGGTRQSLLGVDRAQGRLQLAVDAAATTSNRLPSTTSETLADLVQDGRPAPAHRVGEPEGLDLVGDRRRRPASRSRGGRSDVFEPVELAGDRLQLFQDGAAAGLAGVGGEDGADERPLQQGRPPARPRCRARAAAAGPPRGFRPSGRGAAPHGAQPQGADAGLLLRQVDQVEIDAEGADQGAQRRQVEAVEPVAQPPRLLHRRAGPQLPWPPPGPPLPARRRPSPASRRMASPSRSPSRWMSALRPRCTSAGDRSAAAGPRPGFQSR